MMSGREEMLEESSHGASASSPLMFAVWGY
jgi:hypothetical protein